MSDDISVEDYCELSLHFYIPFPWFLVFRLPYNKYKVAMLDASTVAQAALATPAAPISVRL